MTRTGIDSFPLPIDLAKSFISCFAPDPDKERFDEIAVAFWNLTNPQAMMEAMNADPGESEAIRCIHAFMGSADAAFISSDFASLRVGMQSADQDSEPVVCVDFDLK